jgi:hypothetical protein
MGLFSKKTTSSNTAQTQIDPFITGYGRDTLNMFDALTSGVTGRYRQPAPAQQGGASPYWNGTNNLFPPGDPRRDMTTDQLNAPEQQQPATGPSSFVAPFSNDTQAYLNAARGYTGSGADLRTLAGNVTGGNIGAVADPGSIGQVADPGSIDNITLDPVTQAQGHRASEFMGDYLNPYTGQVVDAALSDYDVGVGRTQNAMRARRDAGSAFGDRAAIADAIYGGEASRGRGALSAGLRADAFNTAANFGAGDAGRFTAASGQNAAAENARSLSQANLQRQAQVGNIANRLQLGGMNADISGRNITNQLALGGMNADIAGRNITNAQNAAALKGDLLTGGDAADRARLGILGEAGAIQDDRAQRELSEPLELLKLRQALLNGTPYNTTVTSNGTSKTSGGLGNDIVGGLFKVAAGAAAAGAFGCWVAREVYGNENPRWLMFREWMLNDSPAWFRNAYIKYGERIAAWISDKPLLKSIIRKWMNSRIGA